MRRNNSDCGFPVLGMVPVVVLLHHPRCDSFSAISGLGFDGLSVEKRKQPQIDVPLRIIAQQLIATLADRYDER